MPYRRRAKKSRLLLLILIVIILGGGYSILSYQNDINSPVDATNIEPITISIKSGDTINKISQTLAAHHLIRNENSFKLYTRLGGYDRKVISGRFILNQSLTVPQIVQIITNTTPSELIVTVPEGSTILEIDQRLVELELIEAGEFAQETKAFTDFSDYPFLNQEALQDLAYPLEGYLFPDTYFVNAQNFASSNLIQIMLENFNKKLQQAIEESNNEAILEEYSTHNIVTMASILEKEVRTSKDIPIVAGILWKRLENNWLLGADATLLYLKNDRNITFQDLQKNSPYNTRKNPGLPPGPIGNPGLATLQAALQPEQSQYWYYLTTLDTGEVIYATTNDEHNANKARYL